MPVNRNDVMARLADLRNDYRYEVLDWVRQRIDWAGSEALVARAQTRRTAERIDALMSEVLDENERLEDLLAAAADLRRFV